MFRPTRRAATIALIALLSGVTFQLLQPAQAAAGTVYVSAAALDPAVVHASEQFTISYTLTVPSQIYDGANGTLYWGDGTFDDFSTTSDILKLAHTYASEGQYVTNFDAIAVTHYFDAFQVRHDLYIPFSQRGEIEVLQSLGGPVAGAQVPVPSAAPLPGAAWSGLVLLACVTGGQALRRLSRPRRS